MVITGVPLVVAMLVTTVPVAIQLHFRQGSTSHLIGFQDMHLLIRDFRLKQMPFMLNGLALVPIVTEISVKLLPKKSVLQQRLPPLRPLPLQRPVDRSQLNILNMDTFIERTSQIQILLLRIGMWKLLLIHTMKRFKKILPWTRARDRSSL